MRQLNNLNSFSIVLKLIAVAVSYTHLQMKTVMQDVIRNMAFVVSCTTKNTILNTPNIFGKSAQSSYRDMTVGRSYRIDRCV